MPGISLGLELDQDSSSISEYAQTGRFIVTKTYTPNRQSFQEISISSQLPVDRITWSGMEREALSFSTSDGNYWVEVPSALDSLNSRSFTLNYRKNGQIASAGWSDWISFEVYASQEEHLEKALPLQLVEGIRCQVGEWIFYTEDGTRSKRQLNTCEGLP